MTRKMIDGSPAVARVSDINLGLYRTFVQPWVKTWANEGVAEWMRQFPSTSLAVRDVLLPIRSCSLLAVGLPRACERPSSRLTGQSLLASAAADWRSGSRHLWMPIAMCAIIPLRHCFMRFTARLLCKRSLGLRRRMQSPRRRPGTDAAHLALVSQRIDELKERYREGGPREAVLRALLYIRMPEGLVDERGFNLLRRMREEAG